MKEEKVRLFFSFLVVNPENTAYSDFVLFKQRGTGLGGKTLSFSEFFLIIISYV